jgi:hypothetical protein
MVSAPQVTYDSAVRQAVTSWNRVSLTWMHRASSTALRSPDGLYENRPGIVVPQWPVGVVSLCSLSLRDRT